jgi:HK97 family phage prohead protease/HK97 family phage major capsid protein
MTEMETREVEFRLDQTEERTITGIAVPYGQTADIGSYQERFAPGSIQDVTDVKIFYGHNHNELPIGKVIAGRETPQGYEVTAKLTEGVQRADETLALMRDGVLNKFSVGFMPVEQNREGNVVTRTLINLRELSVVNWPAYSDASITQVREEQETVPIEPTPNERESEVSENTELDVRAIQDELVEVRRMVEANVAPSAPSVVSFTQFRSQGEFAKALVTADEHAIELFRTYSPATTADTYLAPGWVGFINNLIDQNRPTWNVWSKGALPATGLTVDYAKVTTNGAAVSAQSAENAAIDQGNIVIDNVSATVKTYAGQTKLSKQLVERSSVPFLDTAFQAMSIAYANATNAAAVSAIAALDFTGKVMDMDGGTAKSVLEGIIDGAKYIKVNSGLNPEFILAGPALYKYLVTLADSQGRPIVRVDGGAANGESIGASPAPLQASVWNLPIIVDTTLGDTVGYMANSQALRVYESSGAPIRLVDDISGQSTLTNAYGVYGYAAITVPFESAIVKLDFTA